jgi:hypothetical protein
MMLTAQSRIQYWGTITLDDEHPESIKFMLEFLYLYSDCLEMPWVDDTEFEKDPNIYDKIPSEFGRLASVLAVAVRYGVVGLVKAVEERLRERLPP